MKYSDRGSRFLEDRIYYDDPLSTAYIAYTRYDKLACIVASRYPYIFIDKYQDTSEAMIDILLCRMLPLADNKFMLGFLSDKMQDIYHHGEHKGIGEPLIKLAAPLEVIVKRGNCRCSLRVMDVLSNVRIDIMRIPGSNNAQDDVAYIRVAVGTNEADLQRTRDLLIDALDWGLTSQGTREFYPTRRLITHKTGFTDLLQAFTDRGSFAKDTLTDGSNRRIAFFLEKVEPLTLAWGKGQIGETPDRLHGVGHQLASRTAKFGVRDMLNALTAKRTASVIHEVPKTIRGRQLFPPIDDLALQLVDMQPILIVGMDDTAREREQLGATLYGTFPVPPYQQVAILVRFFMTSIPFATKYGVKRDELDTMLVVLDDPGTTRTFYSFGKCPSGANEAAKPECVKWSRDVFYVCYSRVRQKLTMIDPTGASAAEDKRMRTLLGLDRCYKVQQHDADPRPAGRAITGVDEGPPVYLLYRGRAVGPCKGFGKPLLDVHFRLCSACTYWPYK